MTAKLARPTALRAGLAVAVVLGGGCFSDAGSGDGGESGECPAGLQQCPCLSTGTCMAGLVCEADVCVPSGTTTATTTTTTGTGANTTIGSATTAGSSTGPMTCEQLCPSGACVADVCTLRAFVSSVQFAGAALGGLAGADAQCQQLADAESLGGIWMAWLSDSDVSVLERFDPNGGAYVLVDATPVASSWADLLDGSLTNPIALDEAGFPGPMTADFCARGPTMVWSGTRPDGTIGGGVTPLDHCANWTAQGNADFGSFQAFDALWSQACSTTFSCTELAPLYCFEQDPGVPL